ncbi:MAG: hypothetical protein GWO02_05240, partial [Gammaproteobacteria bacterium]|nr:hypothetical protein [Gammaproteobacteria bacterium]
ANRTLSKAESLAAELGAEAHGLDAVPTLLCEADVIVGAVTGPDDLVTAAMMEAAGPAAGGCR